MTAIVAIVEKGIIYIGGDSAGVNKDTLSIMTRKDEKVFINKDFIFGITTSFRMGNILRYSFEPPKQPNNIDDIRYMNTLFVDSIRDCFREGGFFHQSDLGEGGGVFIVGYKKHLYEIEADFQIAIPQDNYISCGCGHDICLGSLYSTKDREPKERIRIALEAAEKFSAGVRKPFVIRNI